MRFGVARLPEGATHAHILGILCGSLAAGAAGYLILRFAPPDKARKA